MTASDSLIQLCLAVVFVALRCSAQGAQGQTDVMETAILVLDPDARPIPHLEITVIDGLGQARVARTNTEGIARMNLAGRKGAISARGFVSTELQFPALAMLQRNDRWAVAALSVAKLDDPIPEEFLVRLPISKTPVGSLVRLMHISTGTTQVGRVENGNIVRFLGPLRGAYCIVFNTDRGGRAFVVSIHPSDRALDLKAKALVR